MDQIYIGKQSTIRLYRYVRRISNYTSYVRRIIRYQCTVCIKQTTNSSVIQSSFWCETCEVQNAFTSEKETSETTCEIP